MGSCLELRNDTRAGTSRDLTEQGCPGGKQSQRTRTALPCGSWPLVYGGGPGFHIVSGQLLWLGVRPGGAHPAQPGWIPAGDSGR